MEIKCVLLRLDATAEMKKKETKAALRTWSNKRIHSHQRGFMFLLSFDKMEVSKKESARMCYKYRYKIKETRSSRVSKRFISKMIAFLTGMEFVEFLTRTNTVFETGFHRFPPSLSSFLPSHSKLTHTHERENMTERKRRKVADARRLTGYVEDLLGISDSIAQCVFPQQSTKSALPLRSIPSSTPERTGIPQRPNSARTQLKQKQKQAVTEAPKTLFSVVSASAHAARANASVGGKETWKQSLLKVAKELAQTGMYLSPLLLLQLSHSWDVHRLHPLLQRLTPPF